MEPIIAFALAAWPVWLTLAAVGVVAWVERHRLCPQCNSARCVCDTPCGCDFGQCCGFCEGCCLEERLAREADAGNRAYLLSSGFCCGEVEVGNPACPGCPFRYHSDDSWGR